MSEAVRMACADIMGVSLCALMCIALVGLVTFAIICAIKWLKGDFKEE